MFVFVTYRQKYFTENSKNSKKFDTDASLSFSFLHASGKAIVFTNLITN